MNLSELLTMMAPTRGGSHGASQPAGGVSLRPCDPADTAALGALYFAAYPPGVAGETEAEAIADIEAAFSGDYGPFWPDGSALALSAGAPVAALLAVRRAPWADTPDCPFVIDLFTDRACRRRGLARFLLRRCLAAARAAGEPGVALRVDAENAPARALYASLGFAPWLGNESAGNGTEPVGAADGGAP